MTPEWKERVLQLRHRKTEDEDKEFVRLVDEAENKCDYETCKILMQTFFDEDDFGVQECVNSVLATATTENYQRAFLEELPRMIKEANKWAETFIEIEVEENPEILLKLALTSSQDVKNALKSLLERTELFELSPLTAPTAKQILEIIKKG